MALSHIEKLTAFRFFLCICSEYVRYSSVFDPVDLRCRRPVMFVVRHRVIITKI